ncbi:ubiquinone biosynthesis protein COQ9 [Constrictibacter sp. MBR-5]|jgi:ubiquinone biosynthesis protein COQ9|uniref:COQ9 family protein n=1 Tax=Constrictibacter sp. MBR-5 TaxID=3156467 RepID=UPI003394C5A2
MSDTVFDPEIEAMREELVAATLPHVPFDGWTMAALRAGARDAGMDPADVMRAFPGGPAEAVACHSQSADRRMVDELGRRDLALMKVREKVAAAVMIRLEQNAADREAIRRGLSLLSLPQNAPLAARLLYRTVDAIWYACGDTATDYNYYTKRGLLAGVYAATLLYWLDDASEDFADTRGFLDRRIAGIMKIPQAQAGLSRLMGRLPNPMRYRPSRIFRDVGRARYR